MDLMEQHESTARPGVSATATGISTGTHGSEERPTHVSRPFDWSQVLARIPDVTQKHHRNKSEKRSASLSRGRSEERLISPRLSAKLLMGGGALLVGLAIVPFLFSGGSGDESVSSEQASWQPDPPAPTADEAPRWESVPSPTLAGLNKSASEADGPGGPLPQSQAQPAQTSVADVGNLPGPLNASTVQATYAPYRPGGTSDYQAASRADPIGQPVIGMNRPMAIGNRPPTAGSGRPPAAEKLDRPTDEAPPAVSRSSAWPRNDPPVEACYRPSPAPSHPAAGATNYPTTGAGGYPAIGHGNPPALPSRGVPSDPNYRGASSNWPPRPGVAQLEGVIRKPVVRMTDERARPGFH